MLKYGLLAFLCLLTAVQCHIQPEFMKRFYKSPVPIPENYVIAPELSSDKESFAVVHYYQENHSHQLKLQVQLYILNENDDAKSKGCSFNFRAREDAVNASVTALNRLGSHTFVLTWYDEAIDEYMSADRRYEVVAVSMYEDCKQIKLITNISENPFVTASNDKDLDVIVNDPDICDSVGNRCRINYNLRMVESNESFDGCIKPFDVHFNWSSIQVKRLRGGGLLVQGYDNQTYRMIGIRPGSDKTDMPITVHGQSNMEFVSSEFSFCWNVDPGSMMTLTCVQYDQETNNFTLRQNVNLYEDVHLIDVRNVRVGQVLLVAKKAYCDEDTDDCWELLVTKVQQGLKDSIWYGVTFPCTGDQKKLVIFDTNLNVNSGQVNIRYACRNDNGYTFSDIDV